MNTILSKTRYIKYQVRASYLDISGRRIEALFHCDVEGDHPYPEMFAREFIAQTLVSLGCSGIEIKTCFKSEKDHRKGECDVCSNTGTIKYTGMDGDPVLVKCDSCSTPPTQQQLFHEMRSHFSDQLPEENFDQTPDHDLEIAVSRSL